MTFYYHILLPYLPDLFTYSSPQQIPLGSLVEVSFRRKKAYGLVFEKTDQKPDYKTIEIKGIIHEEVLEKWQIELILWITQYYFAPLHKVARLFVPSAIWKNKSKIKREEFLELNYDLETGLEKTKRAKKQQELFQLIAKNKKSDLSAIRQQFSSVIIKTLLEKKLIKKTYGQLIRGYSSPKNKQKLEEKKLTPEQEKACQEILKGKQRSFLLHGITSSGKTEIYSRIISKTLQDKKTVLMLVPEIALTTQLILYLQKFSSQIAVIHSQLTESEKSQEWYRIYHGQARIVVGSRSALFAPLKNLGLIILDEEHEWTYKQEQNPRYHARAVAQKMLEFQKEAKLILGSATPDVETYFQAKKDQIKLLELKERVFKTPLPKVDIVDLRDEFRKKNYSIFSDLLQEKLKESLENKEQAMLFINKRGVASCVVCRECGHTEKCDHCDISLTYHHTPTKDFLLCHHCGLIKKPPIICPKCKSANIRYLGIGTQRVESELKKMFPQAKVFRADRDTVTKRKDFEEIFLKFKDHQADFLVGT
ncbi:MAG TPA: primosomal protein N', partial [Candidatus Peregrinibacteria bacterium]|nr:primosomal protein N' [Candidatus Peregrinibacteria bacterium]